MLLFIKCKVVEIKFSALQKASITSLSLIQTLSFISYKCFYYAFKSLTNAYVQSLFHSLLIFFPLFYPFNCTVTLCENECPMSLIVKESKPGPSHPWELLLGGSLAGRPMGSQLSVRGSLLPSSLRCCHWKQVKEHFYQNTGLHPNQILDINCSFADYKLHLLQ